MGILLCSDLKFTPQDGYVFAHLFALALYSYEKGLPETIKAKRKELTGNSEKKIKLTSVGVPKEIK